MHEASIAYSILSTLENVLREKFGGRSVKVEEIHVEVGALALIDIEALRFALEVLSKGTAAEGAKITITVTKPRLRCNRCGKEWSVETEELDDAVKLYAHFAPDLVYSMLQCPHCGSRDVEVVEGLDVKLKSVRVSEEEGMRNPCTPEGVR